VDALTDRRASKQIDLKQLLEVRIQKFAQEKRFWWRESYATINLTAGQGSYDLSDPTVLPTQDMEEIIAVGINAVDNNGNSVVAPLAPVFKPLDKQRFMLSTSQGTPTSYFMQPGAPTILRLFQTPSATGTLFLCYWAIPASGGDDEDIPLVPTYLHPVLVDGLKMDVFEFIFGPESQKYTVAAQDYANGVAKAMAKPAFSIENKPQFIVREHAIRST
jgi:hypothetical protein